MNQRFNVISNQITAPTFESAIENLLLGLQNGQGGYVCFVNAHLAVAARENDDVRAAINGSFMSLPDGRPVFVAGRL